MFTKNTSGDINHEHPAIDFLQSKCQASVTLFNDKENQDIVLSQHHNSLW